MKKYSLIIISYLIIFSGCSKENEDPAPVTPPNNNSITINSNWQYSLKFDGVSFTNVEGVNDFAGGYGWDYYIASLPDTSKCIFYSSFSSLNSSGNAIGVQLGTVYFQTTGIDTTKFKNFFQLGSVSYTSAGQDGVSISWSDSNGMSWSSYYSPGDQTGSNFIITDVKSLGDFFGDFHVKIKATFNCKVYDINGNSKTITDGIYVGNFENL